jgi:hypothetical protein
MSKVFLRALSGVVTDPSRTPLIPVLLPALERHGRVCLSEAARARLLAVSAATMDRLLSEVLVVARGGQRRRSGFSSAVRRAVPVRTFGDWNDPLPSYVEVDLVAHAGTSAAGAAGSFVQTVVLTDVATGWTESLEMNWLADRCERSGCGAGGALAAAMGDERWPAARLAVAGRWHCSPPRAASGRRGGGGATSTFNRRTAKSISHRFARVVEHAVQTRPTIYPALVTPA